MRRSRAITHLREAIEVCERDRLVGDLDPLVVELWATGSIFDPGDLPGGVEAVFVLDLPPAQVPWGVTPPVLRSFVAAHRLENKPIVAHARPTGRPVCTVALPRAVRVWSVDGTDEEQLEALADPGSHAPDMISIDEMSASDLEEELAISRQFLIDAASHYWDRDWRREHRGSRQTPELMLWEAIRGHLQLTGDLDPD